MGRVRPGLGAAPRRRPAPLRPGAPGVLSGLGRHYLALALGLAEQAPELVDSYTGPAGLRPRAATPEAIEELRAAVRGAAAPGPAALPPRSAAASPARADAARRRWLDAQLRALAVVARKLAGEAFSYRELVERCYGVPARLAPEDEFAAAHARLDEALPGGGALPTRYQAWLERQRVPPERILPALTSLAEELRERTRAAFGLPDGEGVEFVLVTGERYAGLATHLGGLRTRIAINADLPLSSGRLLELVAHEAYPGHHTEQVHKLAALGHDELHVFLYPTPQALVSEGIALLGPTALLGDDTEVTAPPGIPFDPETAAVARQVREALLPVRTNIAIRLDEGELTHEQARAYARRWLLDSDAHVQRTVDDLLGRAWQPYESCYPEGLALCRAFTEREPDGFARLLREQLTTEDLVAARPYASGGGSCSAASRSVRNVGPSAS